MLSGLLQPEKVSDAFEHRGWAAHSEESWLALMPEAELKYSLNAVKRAGKRLRDGCETWDELIESQEIFENWQDCHSYPLRYFYETLSEFARQSARTANVVQRRKRLDAILKKLRANHDNQLTTMQDIAGCRAIVRSMAELKALISVCQEGWADHAPCETDDYLLTPDRKTGYRSVHLIYRFKSDQQSFNRRFVEVQFRTRLQHAWATAVEIIDLFQGQSLKAGKGDPQWQRFFALMGSAIAKIEGTVLVPDTPTARSGQELQEELRHYAELLRVAEKMRSYGSIAKSIHTHLPEVSGYSGYYFLMELDADFKLNIQSFSEREAPQAYSAVKAAERKENNPNVVLVAAGSFEKLKEAYPNWLIDTHNFLMALDQTLKTEFW